MTSTVTGLTREEIAALLNGDADFSPATDIVATSDADDFVSSANFTTTEGTVGVHLTPATTTVNPYLQEAKSLEVNGTLSYAGMLTVLENADTSGMTVTKLQELRAVYQDLNVAGGIKVSTYLQQIAYDVLGVNTANVSWNGGNAKAVALGNLTATSTQTQFSELVAKWFLGTDLPSMNLAAVGGDGGIPVAYEATNLPLFGPAGPSYLAINQGDLGDCYFLATLGEVALQDPSLIESMIQSNGNNTYSVRFDIGGHADYETVNDYLPAMQDGYKYANGDTLLFANSGPYLWVPLFEKAYVQLMEQTGVTAGSSLNQHGDAYEDTAGGWGQSLTELTGESYYTYGNLGSDSKATLNSLVSTLQHDLSIGEEVILGTSGNAATGNLVADHMFMVTYVNVAADALRLQNPWGANSASNDKAASFSESLAGIVADNATIFATYGKVTNV